MLRASNLNTGYPGVIVVEAGTDSLSIVIMYDKKVHTWYTFIKYHYKPNTIKPTTRTPVKRTYFGVISLLCTIGIVFVHTIYCSRTQHSRQCRSAEEYMT